MASPISSEELLALTAKIQMDLNAAQAKITQLRAFIANLDLPEPDKTKYRCPECQLEVSSERKRDEHVYNVHGGPEPKHWAEAEQHAEEIPA